jgi:hypothetical protein
VSLALIARLLNDASGGFADLLKAVGASARVQPSSDIGDAIADATI